MNTLHTLKTTAAAAMLLLCLPASASAGGLITVGTEWAQNGGTATVSKNSVFLAHLEAGRSYTCTAVGQATGSALAFDQMIEDPNGVKFPGMMRGATTPSITTIGSDQPADNRIAVIPTISGNHLFKLSDAKSGGEEARLECVETTLYSAFNTNVNDFNFLELTNITNSSVDVSWTAIVFDGTTASGTATVPANRRVDIDLHSVIGNNRFGHVIVSHDGPLGAVRGAVSQYFGTPSDFILSVSVPLETRETTL